MLDNASFTAEDDKVTGFLGANGAGKSTTMRAALGLVTPNAGRALVDGVPFVKTPSPMTAVGAVRLHPSAWPRPYQRHTAIPRR